MTTPIADFLRAYAQSGTARLHMPGHKGHGVLGFEALDITEIRGADELYCPEGIIAESECNATQLFGSGITAYSTEGSSHAIRSMLFLAGQLTGSGSGSVILAGRNAHKALLYGAALCDYRIEWLYPGTEAENSIAACHPTPEQLDARLAELQAAGTLPFAVYLTSPDYLGQCAPLRALADICHSYGCLLLVDNAHGAYLHFMPTPAHPMDLGADLCSDSAHKTLPVITPGAYLHVRRGLSSIPEVKAAMEVTGTTSPSYLCMASLDACNRILAEGFPARLQETAVCAASLKAELAANGVPVLASEELKVVIRAAAMGYTGTELGDVLRSHGAEPEFCDADYLVCMLTPENSAEDLLRLYTALCAAAAEHRRPREAVSCLPVRLEQVRSIREAVFAPHEIVPLAEAEGRICGAPTVSCPPAVPIAISGERLNAQAIALMRAYGFETVSVVKE